MKNVLLVSLLGYLITACGSVGPSGLNGTQGAQGVAGQNGANGINGAGCSVTNINTSPDFPTGGALITCMDGTSSAIANGVKGETGATGSAGTTGVAGTPGTVLSPIQFCAGAPTYPTTFPELGFCAGGNVYGVYSANGGFLALLPPGQYTSNGINSSCNFTIGVNCAVERN